MAKREIKVTAKQLENVDVEYLSLVDRGANRIPFRFMKSDGDSKMSIDLGSIFGIKKAEKVPTIIGVAIQKNERMDAWKEVLQKHDFKYGEFVEAEDGQVQLAKSEEADDMSVYKVNDDVALVLKGFAPFPEGNDFMENMAKSAFFPGMRVAGDVLSETVYGIMASEGNSKKTKDMLMKALDGYKEYVMGLADQVPEKAYRAEALQDEVDEIMKGLLDKEGKTNPNCEGDRVPGAEGKVLTDEEATGTQAPEANEEIVDDPDADVAASVAAADAAKAEAQAGDSAGSGDSATGDAAGGDAGAGDAGDGGDVEKSEDAVADTVQKSQTPNMEELLKGVGDLLDGKLGGVAKTLGDQIEAVSTRVTEIEKGNSDVADRLKKAEDRAAEAVEAMHGTVLGGASSTDLAPTVRRTRKGVQEGGVFDSALKFPGYEEV